MPRPATDLAGARFGRLTVVERDFSDRRHLAAKWKCVCDCGKDTVQRADVLKAGQVQSCGCFATEGRVRRAKELGTRLATHGHTRCYKAVPSYTSWMAMKARCLNPKSISYSRYGGRGIKVCDRWMSFEAFLEDMGERPARHSLDRIDPEGHYEPSNCRWATAIMQGRNKRNSRVIELDGDALTLAGWEERTGIPAKTIACRIDKLGWNTRRALSEPVRKHRSI